MEKLKMEEFVERVTLDLDSIDSLPIGEHAQRLENVHRSLEATLSTIDGL
ncbi:MAG: hypothetical protein NTX12_04705 [Actinobacteria bacterium]|nr:hypothetical protein [Actinomycetota bacterium]